MQRRNLEWFALLLGDLHLYGALATDPLEYLVNEVIFVECTMLWSLAGQLKGLCLRSLVSHIFASFPDEHTGMGKDL